MTTAGILEAWRKSQASVAKPCAVPRWFKRHYPEAYSKLLELTQKLDKYEQAGSKYYHVRLLERIWCLENGLDDRPICQVCGKERVCGFFLYPEPGYSLWCSPRCQASDESCKQKSKSTRKARYGNENYVGLDKSRATREAKYGSFHPASFGAKVKATKTAHFGDPNFVNRAKARQTMSERYGSENWNNAEKAAQTKTELYGDPNYSNREKFKQTMAAKSPEQKAAANEKRKQTCLAKYGACFPTQTPQVRAKTEATCVAKYGVSTPLLLPAADEASARTAKAKAWDSHVSRHELYQPQFSRDEYLANRDSKKPWLWKCRACGRLFEAPWNSARLRCVDCFPLAQCGQSAMERQLLERFEAMAGCEVVARDRTTLASIRRELDMVAPAKNIAVEFDGLYWHAAQPGKPQADKNYHLSKTEACLALGIQLFHVFEDEWIARREAVCSELGRALGWTGLQQLDASQLDIGWLSRETAMSFVDENHVDGFIQRAKLWIGLSSGDGLEAAAGFKIRDRKLELVQLAQRNGCVVAGCAPKLVSAAAEYTGAAAAISEADRRWPTQEKLLLEAGFRESGLKLPAVWEIADQTRIRKLSAEEAKTAEAAVYDCGRVVFIKHRLPVVF